MPSIYTCPKCSRILGYDMYRTILPVGFIALRAWDKMRNR